MSKWVSAHNHSNFATCTAPIIRILVVVAGLVAIRSHRSTIFFMAGI